MRSKKALKEQVEALKEWVQDLKESHDHAKSEYLENLEAAGRKLNAQGQTLLTVSRERDDLRRQLQSIRTAHDSLYKVLYPESWKYTFGSLLPGVPALSSAKVDPSLTRC